MADVVREQMPAPVAASAAAMIDGVRAALPAMPSTTTSFLEPGHRLSYFPHVGGRICAQLLD